MVGRRFRKPEVVGSIPTTSSNAQEAVMIPMEACQDRQLYRLRSRNLRLGVYSAATHGFLGIREKFGARFAAEEYHWDTGPPFGTAKPLEELLEQLPEAIVLMEILPGTVCRTCGGPVEYNGKDAWFHLTPTTCGQIRPVTRRNAVLEEWLEEMERRYPR